MVTVPVRAGPEFAAMLRFTVPLPVPLAPLVMAIHGALLVAVQPQPAAVVTLTLVRPPPEGALKLVGPIVYVQVPWLTVKVCPAMVAVPLREPPGLAGMLRFTVPLPVPLPPLVMVIHGALLVAVQAQPVPVVTLTLVRPPPEGALKLVGLIVYVHVPWLTLTSTPAMVAVPLRSPPLLAAIRNVTSAGPVPFGADPTAIQAACETAVHEQTSSVEIVNRTSPPLGPRLAAAGDTVALHAAASCVISAR